MHGLLYNLSDKVKAVRYMDLISIAYDDQKTYSVIIMTLLYVCKTGLSYEFACLLSLLSLLIISSLILCGLFNSFVFVIPL